MHARLVQSIRAILKKEGVSDASLIVDARGISESYTSRPEDIVALEISAEEKRLVIDAVVTSVYRNSVLSRSSCIIGYA
jgi:hypothetical protein